MHPPVEVWVRGVKIVKCFGDSCLGLRFVGVLFF